MTYKSAFQDNHTDFEIREIVYDDDVVGVEPENVGDVDVPGYVRLKTIKFEYSAPNISVDVAGRFATHEIIGGATVRQKIGEDPVEVEIEGVCREDTARALDGLRDAKFGTIYSNRLVDGSLRVQFASISTSPLEDGGAVAVTDTSGEFLYEFNISTVEVVT